MPLHGATQTGGVPASRARDQAAAPTAQRRQSKRTRARRSHGKERGKSASGSAQRLRTLRSAAGKSAAIKIPHRFRPPLLTHAMRSSPAGRDAKGGSVEQARADGFRGIERGAGLPVGGKMLDFRYRHVIVLHTNTEKCELPILYTPGQLMTALGLSKQRWRTFRAALSPLESGPGHAGCFSAGHLVAASVAQVVTDRLSAPLSTLTPIAGPLFAACTNAPWFQLERSRISIFLDEEQVELMSPDMPISSASLAIIVALEPITRALRQRLLDVDIDPQHNLAFAPLIASAQRR